MYKCNLVYSASGLRPWPTFREYTPIAEGPGYFLVPIKIYRPNYNSDNSKGGLLTPWLEQLSVTIINIINRLDQNFKCKELMEIYIMKMV